jgi:hypothetical protein
MPKVTGTVHGRDIKVTRKGDKYEVEIDNVKLNDPADYEKMKAAVGKTVEVTVTEADLTTQSVGAVSITPREIETKAKVSAHFLNSYFTTDDTLKNYQGDLFDLSGTQDIIKTKDNLAVIISKGFKGIELSYFENRVMKGIFSLIQKQEASENRPFVVLDNISQLYEQILERKVAKKLKDGYAFKDFSGAEITKVNEALEKLSKTPQQIIVKGRDGVDKKDKPTYFFYMKKEALISLEYLKRNIPADEVDRITEGEVRETGQIKINVLPIFLRDYHKYYKLLPKDISKEVREACPEVKKISEPIVNFIDYLHRHDTIGLINGNELHRSKEDLIKALKLEKLSRKNKKLVINTLLKCYDIAKRTGYLSEYQTDQRGKYKLVDVFYLNLDKYEHLQKPKRVTAETKQEAIEVEKG